MAHLRLELRQPHLHPRGQRRRAALRRVTGLLIHTAAAAAAAAAAAVAAANAVAAAVATAAVATAAAGGGRLQLSNARGGALQRRGVVRRLRRGGLRLRGERALGGVEL